MRKVTGNSELSMLAGASTTAVFHPVERVGNRGIVGRCGGKGLLRKAPTRCAPNAPPFVTGPWQRCASLRWRR